MAGHLRSGERGGVQTFVQLDLGAYLHASGYQRERFAELGGQDLWSARNQLRAANLVGPGCHPSLLWRSRSLAEIGSAGRWTRCAGGRKVDQLHGGRDHAVYLKRRGFYDRRDLRHMIFFLYETNRNEYI